MDIEKIIDIIKEADKIVLEIYNRYVDETNSSNIDISYKKDDSPITEADKKASDFICEELERLYPNIPIICEETSQVEYNKRKEFEYFWLVDPLDGTKEFINKNGEFTINIALIKNNKSVLGVVSVPYKNRIYYAEKGRGAHMIENGIRKRIRCKKVDNNNDRVGDFYPFD